MNTIEDILEHYGVKGMRWGVRRRRSSDSSGSSKPKSKPKAQDLTDDELKSAIARMELERRYTQLAGGGDRNPSRAVTDFILSVGTTAAKTAITNAASQQIGQALGAKAKKK